MAMLTFLRIGKEIHDETEAYLISHLLHRRQRFHERILAKCRVVINRGISRVLALIGLEGFI